jgi:hypothetical protein
MNSTAIQERRNRLEKAKERYVEALKDPTLLSETKFMDLPPIFPLNPYAL